MDRRVSYLVIVVVCVLAFFVNNEVITPDIMESRNIVTAREMVYDGHWMVPTMNGELRLEKPPLPTWLAAVAEILSPDDIAAQRYVAGLAALMLVLFFCRFAEKILNMNPLVPGLLLCTCYNIILMGRTATWDIWCHATMMGAIYCLSMALTNRKRFWGNFIAAGIFIGLSFMSKGPVSLYALFLPFLICFIAIGRPHMRGKGTAVWTMIVLAVVIGTWWYAYLYVFQADAISQVAAKESGAWVTHNTRPWYYYWKFFLETGVWSLLLLTAIFVPITVRKARYSRTMEYLFSLGWMLLVLVLLSVLPEKKPRYLLPILIPASLTMAGLIEGWIHEFERPRAASKADKVLFRVNALLIEVAVIALPVAAYLFLYRNGFLPMWMLLTLSFVCLFVAVWLSGAALRLRPQCMVRAVALLFAFAECGVMPFLNGVINNPERNSISATRDMDSLKSLDFYRNEDVPMRIEIVYAANKKIRPLCLSEKDSVMSRLPMALVTQGRVGDEVSGDILSEVDTVFVGCYDDNPRPKSSRRYGNEFIYNVTILKEKAK